MKNKILRLINSKIKIDKILEFYGYKYGIIFNH